MTATQPAAPDILEALLDPVLLVDGERRVVAANAAARALLPKDLVGRDLALSIRHPDVLDALRSISEDGSSREVEVTLAGTVSKVYLWADSPERAFVERTAAAIMVLLAVLIAMNLLAVILFEKRR